MRKMRDSATMPPTTPPAIAPTGGDEDCEEGGVDGEVDAGVADDDVRTGSEEAGGVEDEAEIEEGIEEVVDAIVAGSGLITFILVHLLAMFRPDHPSTITIRRAEWSNAREVEVLPLQLCIYVPTPSLNRLNVTTSP